MYNFNPYPDVKPNGLSNDFCTLFTGKVSGIVDKSKRIWDSENLTNLIDYANQNSEFYPILTILMQ